MRLILDFAKENITQWLVRYRVRVGVAVERKSIMLCYDEKGISLSMLMYHYQNILLTFVIVPKIMVGEK